jgi:60 kDa SS-A/Ro ribonucleoprotein
MWNGAFARVNQPAAQLVPASAQVFDAFIILSDNETWAGNQHCSQALAEYRKEVNPAARLVCCAMAANQASVVDPDDALSIGCAGLDANLPAIVAEFIGR